MKPGRRTLPFPDLFRRGSKVSLVLRWLMEHGEVSAAEFKSKHVSLGGTVHSTHAFDRYYVARSSQYVPEHGSYGLIIKLERIKRIQRAGHVEESARIRWIGTEGATFEERSAAWLAQLSVRMLDQALEACEREVTEADIGPDREALALRWFLAVQTEIGRRGGDLARALALEIAPIGASS